MSINTIFVEVPLLLSLVPGVGVNGWLTTQPNNYEDNQACLAMYKGHYKWADETCSGGDEVNMYGYVCQYGRQTNTFLFTRDVAMY